MSMLLNILLSIVCIYLYKQCCLDGSTQLLNKHQFNKDVRNLKRKNDTVVVIDIDKFKHINDSKGHAYGDEVILIVVRAIKASVRSSDRSYRIGGDEFAVITSDATVGIRIQDELLRRLINVSTGHGSTYEEADASMYACKRRT